MARCAAIAPTRYQTGMIFNPDGMETHYERALCFQRLAAATRDRTLCRHVRERASWFFDGAGISPGACLRLVDRGIAEDRARARTLREPQRLESVRVARNGNGKDFDIHLRTSGGSGIGLRLSLSVIDPAGLERTLRTEAQPMDDRPGELNIFVPATTMAGALGPAPRDRPFVLRARMERSLQDPDDRRIYALAPHLRLSSTVDARFVPGGL